MHTLIRRTLLRLAVALIGSIVFFGTSAQAAVTADNVCPRSQPGSTIAPPPELHSAAGVLELSLHIRSVLDTATGITRYCYVTDDGVESPTLRVNPGDKLIIHFHNDLPPSDQSMAGMQAVLPTPAATSGDAPCAATMMTSTSTNMHFHGMNVSPICHADEVVHTLLQPGESFDYTLDIPANEPAGLYWYHPHPHGFSEMQTQGGATGAIIVEGIQNSVPALASLPERTLVLRDQLIPAANQNMDDPDMPAWDLSLNFVPVHYPRYVPAIIPTRPSQQEFWRVANQAADLIYDLQVVVNGSPIPLQIYAIDGVPVNAGPITDTHIHLPPGARAEFVLTTPGINDVAQLITREWDTGPDGDRDPQRTIAQIKSDANAPALPALPAARQQARPAPKRFANLAQATPVVSRKLYFSETNLEGDGETEFYITVFGQVPHTFDMNQGPNLTVHQGTVEDWTIQNSAREDHVFHIHQIHFQVLEIDGQPVNDPALRDTVNIPYWSGTGPYHSVKLRMDFRDSNIVGTFPFHCHILEHEDEGMMGLIQVLPAGITTSTQVSSSIQNAGLNSSVDITATVQPASQGTAAPTGIVEFTADDGSSGLWQVPVTNGKAVLTTNLTATGTHAFTGVYQGDANYNASQSTPISITVPARNFTMNSPAGITVVAGASGSTSVTILPQGGFTDTVVFTCALPPTMAGASCSFSPSTITSHGSSTFTIHTTAATQTTAAKSHGPLLATLLFPLGFVGLAFSRAKSRKAISVLLGACVLALILFTASCGGSGNSKPTPTPAGSYTVTVIGTSGSGPAAITNQLQVPVTVQ